MNQLASEQMVTAAWWLVAIYSVTVLFFVVRGAMRTKSMRDYAVGSSGFSPWVVGLSLAASMTSASTFIIVPGLVGLYGLSGFIASSVVLPIACLTSLILLTKGFQKYGQSVKAATLAQWVGTRYKSRGYSLFFAVASLLLITFIVLINVGLTKVISKSLNLDELTVLIGLTVFVFGYMTFGGANSMVYTNTIQAGIMFVVAIVLIGSGYEHFSEGVTGFLGKLKAIDPNLAETTNPSSILFRDYFEIIFCQFVVGAAVVCQPHILTKSLLLRSSKDTNKFLWVVTGVMITFFMVIIAGLYARIAFPEMSFNGQPIRPDGLMSAYVVREFPVYIAVVVILGLMSAGFSTLEGLIQSVSTSITTDILNPLFGRFYPSDEGKRGKLEMRINRFVILILGVVTVFVSYEQLVNPKLSVIILAQNGVYIFFAAAFIPVLFGTYFKDVPKIAPMAASVTAMAVHLTVYYGGLSSYYQNVPVRNPAIASTYGILSSVTVGLVLLAVFRQKAKSEVLEPATSAS